MDPKKQDLSPELKEVYERVMNTQAPAGGPPPAQPAVSSTPTMSSQPTAPAAQPTPVISSAPEAPKPAEGTQAVAPTPPGPASFSFSGNKMSTPQGTTSTTAGKKKIPPFVIPVGVVVLVIAWAAIWAKVFELF